MYDVNEAPRKLMALGWRATAPFCLTKNGYELVFDTSHFVELYAADGRRVAEAPVNSMKDLTTFLECNGLL